ncbi:MAG TPA: glycosyltransferase family 61 protein [Metabacillus sp.]|nr:glycosyltransferase family 61 protein [Metabacillus sp.]
MGTNKEKKIHRRRKRSNSNRKKIHPHRNRANPKAKKINQRGNRIQRTRKRSEKVLVDSIKVNGYYKEFYTNEVVRFAVPKGDPPQWLDFVIPPEWDKDHKFKNSYVRVVENGSVHLRQVYEVPMLFVMAPNNKLLSDMVFHNYWNYFNPEKIPPYTFLDETIGLLAWAGEDNYWHWLHDILPRFHLLQLSGIKIDRYLLPRLYLPFHFEAIQKLGIPADKIIQIDTNMHIRAKNLVVPSVPFNIGTSVKWPCDFIRRTFLGNGNITKIDGYDRIYISRQDAKWRKVINEEEVMGFLEKKGFKKVVLKNLSIQRQMEIFSSAQFIISPNGAGLANLFFCNPATKVIQLFDKTSDEFVKIANYLNLDYYLLKCKTAPPPSTIHEVMNNLLVDITKLSNVLSRLGI